MQFDDAMLASLTDAAQDASTRAYAPYSRFHVGAALLFEDDAIVSGCNVENASYGLTCCAERNALFRAICERGPGRKIRACAVFHDGPEACVPCGACLQVLSEFVTDPCHIYFSQDATYRRVLFSELLPMQFNKDSL